MSSRLSTRLRPPRPYVLCAVGLTAVTFASAGCSEPAAPPAPPSAAPAPAASAAPEVKAKAFTAKITSAGGHPGAGNAVEVTVAPADGYHVNEEYPYKLRLEAPQSGVKYPKDVVTEVTRTPQLATMKVPFEATAPGTVRVAGTLSLSVCNPDQCVIEKVALATEVKIEAGSAPAAGGLPSMAGVAIPGAVEMTVPDGGVTSLVPDDARIAPDARVAKPWLITLAKGASTTYPAAEVELQGVVLDGAVQLRDDTRGGAEPRRLDAWKAFRAPGAAVTLASLGEGATRVVLFVTSPDASPLAKALPDPKAPPGRRPAPTNGPRKKPAEVVDLQARDALRWNGGQQEARIAWGSTDPAAALDAIVFGPNAAVAEHAHAGAWECLFPLRAAGEVIIAGKAQPVTPGVATCIAPDVKHAWKPAGTEPLVAIQLYAPAGAEQRFKVLAEGDQPASGAARGAPPSP